MVRPLAALLVSLCALSALAQTSETIEVSVTSVDVVVTDGKGNRIRGLTKADFEVLENGKPREISNFSEYDSAPRVVPATSDPAGPAAPVLQPSPTPPPARRIMIVVDNNSLTMTNRRPAMAAAVQFVDRMRPGDRMMVATIVPSFHPRTGWTSDAAELRASLEAIGTEATVGRIELERRRTDQLIDYMVSTAQGGTGLRNRFEDLMNVGRSYAERVVQETRHSLSLLGVAVQQLAQFPERKAIILIGEGFDASPGAEVFQKLETLRTQIDTGVTARAMAGTTRGASPLTEINRYSAATAFQYVAGTAHRKGVPIYAINPGQNEDVEGAIESVGVPDTVAEFTRVLSKMAGYQMVSGMSGGVAFIGEKPDRALSQIASDLGTYYSIGFRAAGPPKNADTIRVRTKQRGYRVRSVLATAPVSLDESIGEMVVANLVVPPVSNELAIALTKAPGTAAGDKRTMKLHVLIPVRKLNFARQGGEVLGGFDVYVTIGDEQGGNSGVNKQTHQIRWPADALAHLMEKNVTFTVDVTLEPGRSQISVAVVDHRSKRTGYERIKV